MKLNHRLQREQEQSNQSRAEVASGFTGRAENDGIAFLFVPKQQEAESFPDLRATQNRPEVYEGILDPALPHPPTGSNGFVGRDLLLQQIKQQLFTSPVLALYGLPGVGKTALALALVSDPEIRMRFCDGILWANPGPHPQLSGILQRWGELLGIPLPPSKGDSNLEPWVEALRKGIGERRFLLLLDDAWQRETIEALQVVGPHCAYLVTTRFTSIATYVAADQAIQVRELEDGDGVRLLTHFAPQIGQYERDIALNLVRTVGGLPLALTLIGTYLGRHAYRGHPRRLKNAIAQLDNVERRLHLFAPQVPFEYSTSLLADGTISLESVFAVSDRQLSPPARQALYTLSILPSKPSSFAAETAYAVAHTSSELLNELCDAGLLEHCGTTRYMLHPVIADYARAQQCGPEAAARLIRYVLNFLETHTADLVALEQERATIITALEWAKELGWQAELIRGVCLFTSFLSLYGGYSLAEQLLLQTYTMTTRGDDPRGLVQIWGYLGTISYQQGNYIQAEAYCQNGLLLARELADLKQVSCLLTELGTIAHAQGMYTQAEAYCQDGLLLARELADLKQTCLLLKLSGMVAKKRGDYRQAEVYFQEGLALACELEDRDLMSLLLMMLGGIAHERGDEGLAEIFYQQALREARELKHRERISVLLSNLAVVADARGDYAQAETYLHAGLNLARELGHRERISLLLLNSGVVTERQGHDRLAETYYQEGLTIAREIGHRERISLLLLNLGELNMQREDFSQAETYYQEGLTIARELGYRERISDLQLHRGTLAMRKKQLDLATSYLSEGLELASALEHPQLICWLLIAWGDLRLEQQQPEAAKQDFRQMLACVPSDHPTLVAFAQYGLARVAAAQTQFAEARELAGESLLIFETHGHRQRRIVSDFLNKIASSAG
jgi:tetratricopeptide (TPR) repeat protein